jgi:hypothetical protein
MDGGRSTGHFGTGFYFFGDERDARNFAKQTNRPDQVSAVDLEAYNLAPASRELHDALREINGNASTDERIARIHSREGEVGLQQYIESVIGDEGKQYVQERIDHFLDKGPTKTFTADEVQIAHLGIKKLPTDRFRLERLYPYTGDMLSQAEAQRIADEATRLYNQEGNIDSASTSVMKAMGYEGVNAVRTRLDNSTYGTVVYDIKEESVFRKITTDQDEFSLFFQDARGAMVRKDSKAVIYSLTSPDVSTPLHEMAHVFEHYLTDAERKQVMEWAGTKEWNRDTSEAFAEGFEAWLAEGGPQAQAQRQQQEAGQPKKMRRFSQRVAQNVEELREDIINNPNSYYEPQVYAEIRERLAEMSHEELVTEMKLSGLTNLSAAGGQIGVMAGIERMNRALAEGDFNTVDAVQEELAKIGTAAGQILRQFGELRTSTPANLVSFIEQQMNKRGNEMTDSQRKVLEGIAQDFLRSQARYKDLIAQITFNDGMTEAEFNALEKEIQSEQEKIASAEKELDTFTNAYVERGFSDLATMMVQGNLLTPMSQITNIFANAVNVATVIPRDIISTMLEGPFRRIAYARGSVPSYCFGVR